MVPMRGSSHPETRPSSTSWRIFRLDVTTCVGFRRANSIWRAWWISSLPDAFRAALISLISQS